MGKHQQRGGAPRAREEIWKSWRETCALNRGYDHPQAAELFNLDKLPAFHDPFAGGARCRWRHSAWGWSYASDLNPVAVTINKAMIEIPPRFAGRPPVGPFDGANRELARRLVRRQGAWPRTCATAPVDARRAGEAHRHLYPKIEVTAEMVAERPDLEALMGQQLTVIAWLWARGEEPSTRPSADAEVPLASTFVLSSKAGKEAYVEPVVEGMATASR